MNGAPFLLKQKAEWPSEVEKEFEMQAEDPEKKRLPSSVGAVMKPVPLLDP